MSRARPWFHIQNDLGAAMTAACQLPAGAERDEIVRMIAQGTDIAFRQWALERERQTVTEKKEP